MGRQSNIMLSMGRESNVLFSMGRQSNILFSMGNRFTDLVFSAGKILAYARQVLG